MCVCKQSAVSNTFHFFQVQKLRHVPEARITSECSRIKQKKIWLCSHVKLQTVGCFHVVALCVCGAVGMLCRADGSVLHWTMALWCLSGVQDPPPLSLGNGNTPTRVLTKPWGASGDARRSSGCPPFQCQLRVSVRDTDSRGTTSSTQTCATL